MTPSRPYLIRALHEWIVDNALTPYVLVDCSVEGVDVPPEHVSDGRIVLNISPTATEHLQIGNEAIEFSARFGGRPRRLRFPIPAVLAVYARENGRGMVFSGDGGDDEPTPEPPGGGKPQLRVVK